MASRGTVKLLSRGKGRSSGKLLPKAEGQGQQFPRASPLTEGQMIDCSPRSHGISGLLPNLLYNFYISSLFATLKSGEWCLINNILITWTLKYHKGAWNRQQFILWSGNSSTVSWYKKSETKLGKQLEIPNYILYSRLGNKKYTLCCVI